MSSYQYEAFGGTPGGLLHKCHGKNGFVSFGSAVVAGKKNQDRHSVNLNHENEGVKDFSSFSCFDGHGDDGAGASTFCAANINNYIMKCFATLLQANAYKLNSPPTLAAKSGFNVGPSVEYADNLSNDDLYDIEKEEVTSGYTFDDLTENQSKTTQLASNSVEPSDIEGLKSTVDLGIADPLDIANCLSESDLSASSLTTQDQMDCLLTESIRIVSLNVDEHIRLHSKGGTTMNSLFLHHDPIAGIVRASCANIGDSRCLMVTTEETEAPSDVKPSDQKYAVDEVNDFGYLHNKITVKRIAVGYQISEDHTLNLGRERQRIEGGEAVFFLPLPYDGTVSRFPAATQENSGVPTPANSNNDSASDSLDTSGNSKSSNQAPIRSKPKSAIKVLRALASSDSAIGKLDGIQGKASIDKDDRYTLSAFEYGIPSVNKCVAAHNFLSEILYVVKNANLSQIHQKLFERLETFTLRHISSLTSLHENMNKMNKVRDLFENHYTMNAKSFIANRINPRTGESGREALFSRHQNSILMTRSIGDLLGPRSCVAIPDVCGVTVKAGKHARFIVASDGFWDVVTSDEVRVRAMKLQYKNPEHFAEVLALKARRRRTRLKMRMDDITVLCVDINSSNFLAINSVSGECSFTRGGVNTDLNVNGCNIN